jgi:hypothetical protein
MRASGLRLQPADTRVGFPVDQRFQMTAGQVAVVGDVAILDTAVEHRADGEGPGPVLGCDRPLQGGEMRLGHGDDASLQQRALPSPGVGDPNAAGEHPASEVESLPVVEDLHLR